MNAAVIQSVKGMNDILPNTTEVWQWVEGHIKNLFAQYGYDEIRLPILEKTELFKRSIGEVTDIVEKEMYSFFDRNNESLTLRPEGTAGCVRAGIEHGLLYNQLQKLWYQGPMFRYERPQKGRYRQFYQIGVEAFGFSGSLIEAELILLSNYLWNLLNISAKIKLQINTLGSLESRQAYKEIFIDYCKKNIHKLDSDSQRRLETNPLRILDSKNPDLAEFLNAAPKLLDYLSPEDKLAFKNLCEILSHNQISYEINPKLVRGLDYYSGTVFEWVTESLGAQGAVCAGGRYDNLVKDLGGKETPAVGFAIGVDRVVELCVDKFEKSNLDIYFILASDFPDVQSAGIHLAEKIRQALPNIRLNLDCAGGSLKSQFKRADKSQAKYAVILGEDELAKNMLVLKNLRQEKPQQELSISELIKHLRSVW